MSVCVCVERLDLFALHSLQIYPLSLRTTPSVNVLSLPPRYAARWMDWMDDGHGKVWGPKCFTSTGAQPTLGRYRGDCRIVDNTATERRNDGEFAVVASQPAGCVAQNSTYCLL